MNKKGRPALKVEMRRQAGQCISANMKTTLSFLTLSMFLAILLVGCATTLGNRVSVRLQPEVDTIGFF